MKRFIFTLPLAAFALVSCQEEKKSDLQALYSQLDSVNTVVTEATEFRQQVIDKIAELDSTTSYTSVTVHEVAQSDFEHYFQVYGSVEADHNVTLYAESAGMVQNVRVSEGQKVSKGQALLQLDADIIRNNIQEVQTSLELAKTLYEKQERLWNQNIGSQVQYLEAKNRYESLKVNLATLQTQLELSNLTAPFSGVVDEIFLKRGEYAAPGMPLIRLVNMTQGYVTADVPESYVNRVNTGDDVTLTFRSIGDTVKAEIIQVGQFINPDNRTFRVKVGIEDANGLYKPNMMASVRIRDYKQDSAVVIPSHLIQQDQNGDSYVYVVNHDGSTEGQGEIARQMVQLGMAYEGRTEIRSGLEANQLVVDRGARSVQAGERVSIVE